MLTSYITKLFFYASVEKAGDYFPLRITTIPFMLTIKRNHKPHKDKHIASTKE